MSANAGDGVFAPYWADFCGTTGGCTTSVRCFLIGLFGPFWRSFTNVRVTFTRRPILEFALVVRMIGVRTSLYAIGTLALVLGVNGCCRSRIFFSRTFAFGIARSFVAIFSFPLLCGRCFAGEVFVPLNEVRVH